MANGVKATHLPTFVDFGITWARIVAGRLCRPSRPAAGRGWSSSQMERAIQAYYIQQPTRFQRRIARRGLNLAQTLHTERATRAAQGLPSRTTRTHADFARARRAMGDDEDIRILGGQAQE